MKKNNPNTGRMEFLRGALDLLILETLRWGPTHGYGLGKVLKASSKNELRADTGTLYPALHRLERRKWISAEWATSLNKQRVKIYSITALGKKQLIKERSQWQRFSDAVSAILGRFAETKS